MKQSSQLFGYLKNIPALAKKSDCDKLLFIQLVYAHYIEEWALVGRHQLHLRDDLIKKFGFGRNFAEHGFCLGYMATHSAVSLESCQQLEVGVGEHSHPVDTRCVLPPGVQTGDTAISQHTKHLAQHHFTPCHLPHQNIGQLV